MEICGITIEAGPGVLITPNETLVATDKPSFTVSVDEGYLTRVFGEKFGLTVKPRE